MACWGFSGYLSPSPCCSVVVFIVMCRFNVSVHFCPWCIVVRLSLLAPPSTSTRASVPLCSLCTFDCVSHFPGYICLQVSSVRANGLVVVHVILLRMFHVCRVNLVFRYCVLSLCPVLGPSFLFLSPLYSQHSTLSGRSIPPKPRRKLFKSRQR